MPNLTESLTIRIDAWTADELDRRASEYHCTTSRLARVLIRDGLLRFADAAPYPPVMHPEAIADES